MLNKIHLPLLLNHKIKFISLIIFLLITVSCFQDPVNIDLSEFGPTIVIEGNITDHPGPHSVRISRTAKYSDPDNFPSVSGATVRIEDNLGNSIPLQEIGTGRYQTSSIRGIPGRTYTLTVNDSGDKYTASSTMPQPLLLNMINFEMIAQDPNIYEFSCSFQDRAGIEDYCLLNLYTDGNLVDHILYNGHQNDGQEIVFDDFNVLFNYHDVVTIDLLTLDKAAYEFFHTLEIVDDREADELAGSFIPVTTFNPTTNLDKGALGYFSAHTLRRYVLVVE
jgi:hypothetical protein